MSNVSQNNPRRGELDGIRAIAVVAILFFHAGFSSVAGGFVGVDVFFVLSGYLITALIVRELENREFSIGRFYARRFTRLFPAAFVTILCTLLLASLLMPEPSLESIRNSALASLFYFSNVFFWMDAGYFSESAITKPLLHMWSLSVEEQFYLVYPFILWAAYRAGGIQATKLVLLVVTLLSFVLCLGLTYTEPSAAYFLMPARFWQLGTGGLLVLFNIVQLDDQPQRGAWPVFGGLAGLACILAAIFVYTEDTAFPGYTAVLPVGGSALLIWAGARSLWIQKLLSGSVLVFTGRISYSLYLVHWPIVVFLFVTGGTPGSWSFAAQCIALSFAAASLLHYAVERPFMRFRSSPTQRVLWVSAVSTAIFASLSVAITAVPLSGFFEKESVVKSLQITAAQSARKFQCTFVGANLCRFGPGDTQPKLAFVGDSHALMLKPTVHRIAQALNEDILVLPLGAFCPPLLGVEIFDKSRSRNERCAERRAAVPGVLAEHGITKVVLVGRWHAYSMPLKQVSLLPTEFSKLDKQQTRDAFLSALEHTVNTLTAQGIEVTLMEQVPEAACDVKAVLAQIENIQQLDAQCSPRTRETLNRRAGFRLQELTTLPLRILLTRDAYCSSSQCSTHKNHKMLYGDSNHLTQAGAELLADFWLQGNQLSHLTAD